MLDDFCACYAITRLEQKLGMSKERGLIPLLLKLHPQKEQSTSDNRDLGDRDFCAVHVIDSSKIALNSQPPVTQISEPCLLGSLHHLDCGSCSHGQSSPGVAVGHSLPPPSQQPLRLPQRASLAVFSAPTIVTSTGPAQAAVASAIAHASHANVTLDLVTFLILTSCAFSRAFLS